jgi:uncharacterized membrane protein YeaQ/YmgE (transglycosylase-associated protein family)
VATCIESEVGQFVEVVVEKEHAMSGTLINLIIQIIAGVLGGHAAGATAKDYTLGAIGNTIAGGVGGAIGGQLLQQLVPTLASAASKCRHWGTCRSGRRWRCWRRYPNCPCWRDEMDADAPKVDLTRPSYQRRRDCRYSDRLYLIRQMADRGVDRAARRIGQSARIILTYRGPCICAPW